MPLLSSFHRVSKHEINYKSGIEAAVVCWMQLQGNEKLSWLIISSCKHIPQRGFASSYSSLFRVVIVGLTAPRCLHPMYYPTGQKNQLSFFSLPISLLVRPYQCLLYRHSLVISHRNSSVQIVRNDYGSIINLVLKRQGFMVALYHEWILMLQFKVKCWGGWTVTLVTDYEWDCWTSYDALDETRHWYCYKKLG